MGKSKDHTLLYAGGGAVVLLGGLYLYNKSKQPVVVPGTTAPATGSGTIPAPPVTYNETYYKTYQYPALVKANPELLNPNHQLTSTEANDYLNNYLELQQWAPSVIGKQPNINSMQQAMQYHWTHYGVAQQYSYVPFTPPKNAQWVQAPPNPNSSGSGGGVLSTLGTVASIAAMFIGVDDRILSDEEIEILITMAPVTRDVIKFYLNTDKTIVHSIDKRLSELVGAYAF